MTAALAILAGKWAVPVMRELDAQPLRYNRLLERLPGVSRRMLSATLQRLVLHGLVERRQLCAAPPRVEYAIPHSGSMEPAGAPRVQEPSDSPGTLTQSLASSSGEPVSRVVGRSPRPRPGGLHQSCGSLYLPTGGVQGPWPLRLVDHEVRQL
jgi:hypothetical protein